MNYSEFIMAHDGEDPAQLALARGRFASEVADFDLALTTLEVRRKLRDKVPEWYAVPSLHFPLRVSGEQCSSTATARYKAGVAAKVAHSSTDRASLVLERADNRGSSTDRASLVRERGIADLTGGLGVDSWAFAQVFDEVLYNEMRQELADAAAHNFRELGIANITVRNLAIVPGDSLVTEGPRNDRSATTLPVIPGEAGISQILGNFRPDVLFLDPARRAADGRKVFRLEDCQPDVLKLLPELLEACPKLLLKLSPMADITLVCRQLGCVREVHVVAADGECKELLLVLEKDWTGPRSLTIVEDGAVMEIPGQAGNDGDTLGSEGPRYDNTAEPSSSRPASDPFCHTERSERVSGLMYEPGKALLKAGAFDLPCRYGLTKLGQHTHLYTGAEVPGALKPFGKCYRVLESAPLDKRGIRAIGRKYLQAEVTARNIPLTSHELRTKLGVRSGGSVHIFGLHSDALRSNLLLVTEKA